MQGHMCWCAAIPTMHAGPHVAPSAATPEMHAGPHVSVCGHPYNACRATCGAECGGSGVLWSESCMLYDAQSIPQRRTRIQKLSPRPLETPKASTLLEPWNAPYPLSLSTAAKRQYLFPTAASIPTIVWKIFELQAWSGCEWLHATSRRGWTGRCGRMAVSLHARVGGCGQLHAMQHDRLHGACLLTAWAARAHLPKGPTVCPPDRSTRRRATIKFDGAHAGGAAVASPGGTPAAALSPQKPGGARRAVLAGLSVEVRKFEKRGGMRGRGECGGSGGTGGETRGAQGDAPAWRCALGMDMRLGGEGTQGCVGDRVKGRRGRHEGRRGQDEGRK
eukprot:359476-Chlamydomonas_euryale.AAC.2